MLPSESDLVEPHVAAGSDATSQAYLCGMLRSFEVLPKHSDLIEPRVAAESDAPSKVYLPGMPEALRWYQRTPTAFGLMVTAEIHLLETSYLTGNPTTEMSPSARIPPQMIRVPVRHTSSKPRISPACVSFEVIPQTFNPVQRPVRYPHPKPHISPVPSITHGSI
jgi:hypothetical protein